MDLSKWRQRYPFALAGADYCPRCLDDGRQVLLEDDYVRDPHTQEHWRGVPALSCPDCEYAERQSHREA